MGKGLLAMSGEPAVLAAAISLATSWEDYVDEAHDSLINTADAAAQAAAEANTSWTRVAPHIKSWVEKDSLVVGLPHGHSMSDEANDLEYGTDDAGPQPVLRKAALHDLDGMSRSTSRSLQWP